ncbi:MAG: signal peptide peptidase SppA [Alphaproteobacteria bacterium]|nr:signal peptide peptidase SppA [Alphaproteobacteria bacterium]
MWSWFLTRLKNIFNRIASIIIFLVLLTLTFSVIGVFTQARLPSDMVLTLDMRQALPDQHITNPFAVAAGSMSVIDVVAALARAESDDRVKGLYLRVGGEGISSAQAEELRDAIKSFRAKGKFVIAHAQAFYTNGLGDYYLASAADQIWMQPVSEMNTAGVAATAVFLKGLLDKVDAVPQFTQRYEYKNAANMFTQTDYTAAHREASQRLIESVFESDTAGMAAERKMTRDQVVALINGAPYLTQDAIDKKLIDKQGYDDEAENAAIARAGGKAELKKLSEYFQAVGSPWEGAGRPTIALIQGEGTINDGESQSSAFGGDTSMGGDTIAKAFRDATEDKDIKAILFRVNSPGGSALASDQILDAIKNAQKAGKKVIVSMADVAASGGYYVSLAADKIFAHETTITGSIGVLSGKIVTSGSWALLGINMKPLGVGENALMQSSTQPFTQAQWDSFNRSVDQIYADFTAKVAAGRKLPIEKVRDIAKGRVWTGADAKPRGLVDEFGGFRAALGAAKALAGIPPDTEINLKTFPKAKEPFEVIADAFGTSTEMVRTVAMLGKIMDSRPVAELMEMLGTDAKENEGPQLRMQRQGVN